MMALILCASPATQAQALNEALRGDYALSMLRICNNGSTTIPIGLQGTVSYDGVGGGTFVGQSLVPAASGIPDGNQASQNCTVTYTVNADGSVAQEFDCSLTFTAGGNTGLTGTLTGVQVNGQLSLDGTVLMLHDTSTTDEILTIDVNPPSNRECTGSGLATSKR